MMAWEDAVTYQNVLDLLDAISIATEELAYKLDELADCYEPDDLVEMEDQRDRLNALFPTLADLAFAAVASEQAVTPEQERES